MLTPEQTLAELTAKIVEAVPSLKTQKCNGRCRTTTNLFCDVRDITLEDVIRASRMKSDCYDMDILDQWTLGKPLAEQSPETISFLFSLLHD